MSQVQYTSGGYSKRMTGCIPSTRCTVCYTDIQRGVFTAVSSNSTLAKKHITFASAKNAIVCIKQFQDLPQKKARKPIQKMKWINLGASVFRFIPTRSFSILPAVHGVWVCVLYRITISAMSPNNNNNLSTN